MILSSRSTKKLLRENNLFTNRWFTLVSKITGTELNEDPEV